MTFEEKIQKVVDIEDIKKLMAKYCHGVDKKEEATFLSIWDEDAVYEVPYGTRAGKDEIKQMLYYIWENVPKTHHHTTNSVIEIIGNDASAVSDVFYYRMSAAGKPELLSGTYTDEYVKKSGGWFLKRRKFTSHNTASPNFENIKL